MDNVPGTEIGYTINNDYFEPRIYAGPITIEIPSDNRVSESFEFRARRYPEGYVKESGTVYSEETIATYTLITPASSPIDSNFHGRWLSLGNNEEEIWSISESGVWRDGERQDHFSANSSSITLSGGNLSLLSSGLLMLEKNESTDTLFFFHQNQISGSFFFSIVNSDPGQGLPGNLTLRIKNLYDDSDSQELRVDASGNVTVSDTILLTDYQITIPVQEGISREITAKIHPLFDGQNTGSIDISENAMGVKVLLLPQNDPLQLIANNESNEMKLVLQNRGAQYLQNFSYNIESSGNMQISGRTSDTGLYLHQNSDLTLSILSECPQEAVPVGSEYCDEELTITLTNSEGTISWTETLSLRFQKAETDFLINTRAESLALYPLLVTPEGYTMRVNNPMSHFPMITGIWQVIIAGGGRGESKYNLAIGTKASLDFSTLTQTSTGEPNNSPATATNIQVGQEILQFIGDRDVDFFSFEFQETHNLIYDANDADSGSVPNAQFGNYGDEINLSANTGNLTKEGKLFAGWHTEADYTDFGATGLEETIILGNGETRVYAAWVEPVKTVLSTAVLLENGTLWDPNEADTPLMEGLVRAWESTAIFSENWFFGLDTEASLWALGDNTQGQLGTGNFFEQTQAQKVMQSIQTVVIQNQSSWALTTTGNLYGWGADYGPLAGSAIAGKVVSPQLMLENVDHFSCGETLVAAIKQDGSLWTIGLNSKGQLGDGTTEDKTTFVKIEDADVTDAAAGTDHLLYIKNGNLWATGNNEYGQLGDGTNQDHTSPIQVMTGAQKIYANADTSFVLDTSGDLYSAGFNTWGQTGRDVDTSWKEFLYVTDLVQEIQPGATLFILKKDKSLWYSGSIPAGYGHITAPAFLQEDVQQFTGQNMLLDDKTWFKYPEGRIYP